jgi:Flp pilus assembly protein TadB
MSTCFGPQAFGYPTCMEREHMSRDETPVPGTGGAPANTREGQQGLRLHAVIAVIAFVLCAFVAIVFFWLGSVVLCVVFAVIALACLGVLGWARRHRSAGPSRSGR